MHILARMDSDGHITPPGNYSKEELFDYQQRLLACLQNVNAATLSDSVRDIVFIPKLDCHSSAPSSFEIVSTEVTIGYLVNIMRTASVEKNGDTYYRDIVLRLTPFFQEITRFLQQNISEGYVSANRENLKWLCVDWEEVAQCVTDGQNIQQGVVYGACLRLTAILERSLQDLLWTVDSSTPIMLKEILQSNTLTALLGDEAVAFLGVLVGPPTSLNIRNLVWHGFGSVHEHPEQYVFVVFFALILIGSQLKQKGIQVAHRPFSQIDTSLLAAEHIGWYKCFSEGEYMPLLAHLKTKLPEIKQAFEYAQVGLYGHATILLLTSFEHIARVAYCVYNHCPNRSITAVSSEYFTTLDHVFEEMSTETTPNVLHDVLPVRLRSAIYDLLYHARGFRLRDKLSHMEISYLDIPEVVWTYCYNILTTTVTQIAFGGPLPVAGDYLINDYVSLYHPLACTTRISNEIATKISLFENSFAPAAVTVALLNLSSHHELCERLLLRFGINTCTQPPINTSHLLFPTNHTYSRNLSVSSGFRPVTEWCRLVHSMCENLLTTVSTMLEYAVQRNKMLEDRTLRARQRKNLVAFYSCKDAFLMLLRTLHSVTVHFIEMTARADCCVQKQHKALLQLMENLSTATHECKWANSLEYSFTFVKSHF